MEYCLDIIEKKEFINELPNGSTINAILALYEHNKYRNIIAPCQKSKKRDLVQLWAEKYNLLLD